jgi:hypothetical protein
MPALVKLGSGNRIAIDKYRVEDGLVIVEAAEFGGALKSAFAKKELESGNILCVNVKPKSEREFGLISVTGSGKVTFLFRNVVNVSGDDVVLAKDMKVKFSRSEAYPNR